MKSFDGRLHSLVPKVCLHPRTPHPTPSYPTPPRTLHPHTPCIIILPYPKPHLSTSKEALRTCARCCLVCMGPHPPRWGQPLRQLQATQHRVRGG